MRREDYVIRLIQRMGQFWGRIVHALRGKDFTRSRALISQAYSELLGMRFEDAQGLEAADLLARVNLGENPQVGRDRTLALAGLLKAEGDLYAAQLDADAALALHHKALDVLLAAPPGETPEYAPDAEELTRLIGVYNVAIPLRPLLLERFEQAGAFGLAEDVLHSLLDDLPESAAVRELGIGFYGRLLRRSDAELAAGNLPRAEVRAALAELRAREG